MATLWLDAAPGSGPVLFDWLGGEWGLLFSDPADFEFDGSDRDRWISDLRDHFHARSVRPLVCVAPAWTGADGEQQAPGICGWISELSNDARRIWLHASSRDRDDPIERAARQLSEDIAALGSRFVLIIDGALQSRAVLRYGARPTSISALDLLGSVESLRRRFFARRPIYSPNVTCAIA